MESNAVLWRPTGRVERDLVARSGWRAWPPRLPDQPIFYPVTNRWYATKIAREWNVPAEGVGHVLRFEVDAAFLERYPVQRVGGRDVLEHWVPAEELDGFNERIDGPIVEIAEFRGPVAAAEFARAGAGLGRELPPAWRDYLGGASWLRRGWTGDEHHLSLSTPEETLAATRAWDRAGAHPGAAIIGGDGAGEHLVLDLREDEPPVLLVGVASAGWETAVPRAASVEELVDLVEAGEFEFYW
ncbi:hypothetical protein [Actinosynnema sp. NPDC020468]|uniref:hypothetical protein n=1 Tax=Actinosynnema sp. NPDC020468 TaxID=3154488 RepID=UPI0033E6FA5D